MAKRLKEGRDAGGFTMEEKGCRERKKEKGNTVGTTYTYLLSFLIPRRRQHWEQTSHWLDLKGERKEDTQKKKKERNRDETLL